jgi:hypothetical protein
LGFDKCCIRGYAFLFLLHSEVLQNILSISFYIFFTTHRLPIVSQQKTTLDCKPFFCFLIVS